MPNPYPGQTELTSLNQDKGGGSRVFPSYQVWAFGRLSVFASIKWMVNSLGPAAPVEP